MRTPRELARRLRQELVNIKLMYSPPRWKACNNLPPLPGFPAPASVAARLRRTAFAGVVKQLAGEILAHRFPLFGTCIATESEIEWRRDYINGKVTGTQYFRRIPYLDRNRAGDHKIVWELNRHQHLVLLAQAYALFDEKLYLEEIVRQIESWWEQNPFQRGINWASALEAAFRALSWIWILHLAGNALPPSFV
ncbi:MAG TPA: heparinase II/III family protein, partial [Bryobacteraceae bacterium]|nr:heparinase II/III family protein [Bryobacteraceae bacterium]